MSAITVQGLITKLDQVKDKEAKVVIHRDGATFDIDEVALPGEDEDYVCLVINTGNAEDDDDQDGAEGDDEE